MGCNLAVELVTQDDRVFEVFRQRVLVSMPVIPDPCLRIEAYRKVAGWKDRRVEDTSMLDSNSCGDVTVPEFSHPNSPQG